MTALIGLVCECGAMPTFSDENILENITGVVEHLDICDNCTHITYEIISCGNCNQKLCAVLTL